MNKGLRKGEREVGNNEWKEEGIRKVFSGVYVGIKEVEGGIVLDCVILFFVGLFFM